VILLTIGVKTLKLALLVGLKECKVSVSTDLKHFLAKQKTMLASKLRGLLVNTTHALAFNEVGYGKCKAPTPRRVFMLFKISSRYMQSEEHRCNHGQPQLRSKIYIPLRPQTTRAKDILKTAAVALQPS
jgi:hypothetical protein